VENRFENERIVVLEEYKVVELKWRFLQGLRYGVIASIATLQASLVVAWNYMLSLITNPTSVEELKGSITNGDNFALNAMIELARTPNLAAYPALIFLPLFAVALLVATQTLEERLQDMYSACSERGRELEWLLGNPHGVFSRLHQLKRKKFLGMDHTQAFKIVVYFTGIMWLALMGMGIYALVITWTKTS